MGSLAIVRAGKGPAIAPPYQARGSMGLPAKALNGFVVALLGHEDLDADLGAGRLIGCHPQLRHPAETRGAREPVLLREDRPLFEDDR